MSCETVVYVDSPPPSSTWDLLLGSHLEDYDRASRDYAQKLRSVWDDLGLLDEDHDAGLRDIMKSVHGVWCSALERAEDGRRSLRERLDEALDEIAALREQLADDEDCGGASSTSSPDLENNGLLPGDPEARIDCARTLKGRYEAALESLEGWRERRAERLKEFDLVLGDMAKLRARLGEPMPPSARDKERLDISLKHLEYLRYELERSHAEKGRRERELEGLLSRVRKICIELGEDDQQMAAEVHPSLRRYQDLMPNLCAFRPSYMAHKEPLKDESETEEIDLSEGTFRGLEMKIGELKNVKIVRQQQAVEICDMLRSLWVALEIPQHDVDRGTYSRLLDGPSRLHTKTLTKCMKEVQRLEKAQAQLLLGLILQKKDELEELCKATHLPMPDVSPLLVGGDGQTEGNCGMIADNLAKLVRMVAEVNLMCEKRAEIVGTIDDLQVVMDEVEWLTEFEGDRSRYSGRGREQNRKLQRALKAGKVREKLPEKLQQLEEAISTWEQAEGQPFIYDGKNYRLEVLKQMIRDIAEKNNGKRGSKKSLKKLDKPRTLVRSSSQASDGPGTRSKSAASTTRSISRTGKTGQRDTAPRIGRARSSEPMMDVEKSRPSRPKSTEVPGTVVKHTRNSSPGFNGRSSSSKKLGSTGAKTRGPSVKAAAARMAAKAVASINSKSKSFPDPGTRLTVKGGGHTRTKNASQTGPKPMTKVVARLAAESHLTIRGGSVKAGGPAKAATGSSVTGDLVNSKVGTAAGEGAAQETEVSSECGSRKLPPSISLTKAKANEMQDYTLARSESSKEAHGRSGKRATRQVSKDQLRSKSAITLGPAARSMQTPPESGGRKMPYNPLQERLNKLMQSVADPFGMARIPQVKTVMQGLSPGCTPRSVPSGISNSRTPVHDPVQVDYELGCNQSSIQTESYGIASRTTPVDSEHDPLREATVRGVEHNSVREAISTDGYMPVRQAEGVDNEYHSVGSLTPVGSEFDLITDLTPVGGEYSPARDLTSLHIDDNFLLTPRSCEDDIMRGLTPVGMGYSTVLDTTPAISEQNPAREAGPISREYNIVGAAPNNSDHSCKQDTTMNSECSSTQLCLPEFAIHSPRRDSAHVREQTLGDSRSESPINGASKVRASSRRALPPSKKNRSRSNNSFRQEGVRKSKATGFVSDGGQHGNTKAAARGCWTRGCATPVSESGERAGSSLSTRSVDLLANLYGKDSLSSVGPMDASREIGMAVTNGVYEKGTMLYGKDEGQEDVSIQEDTSTTASSVRIYGKKRSGDNGASIGKDFGSICLPPKDLTSTSAFAKVANAPLHVVHDSFHSTSTPSRDFDSQGRTGPPSWSVVYCNGCYLDSPCPWSEDGTTVDTDYAHRFNSGNSNIQTSTTQSQNAPEGRLSGFVCNPVTKCFHARGESDMSCSSLSRRSSL